MPDSVPRRRPETSDGIMALLNTVASSAPMIASAKAKSTTGRDRCGREWRTRARKADDEQHREAGDPGLARQPGVGDGAEHRRANGGNQLGAAGGIGP